jgi:multiple sugar transport system permease protein
MISDTPSRAPARGEEARAAWWLVSPAMSVIAAVALLPIAWTFWDSLHLYDLRLPWLGRPWIGAGNYVEALRDPRVLSAMGHTVFFVVTTVTCELAAGMALALVLHRAVRARGLLRTTVLLPWAVPTVVAALVWRFLFDSPAGLVSTLAAGAGLPVPTWFADPVAAWVPLVVADVWKSTPFVAILLLAGLQQIDETLYEAARVDGAGAWRQFVHVTLPLLHPALFVAFLFRSLDAFRVFDVIYVMTGGGPGSATEPIALYTYSMLLQHLRFGYGSALSILVFAAAFLFALVAIRTLGRGAFLERQA